MEARAGVEPTTLRLKAIDSTKAPPCPNNLGFREKPIFQSDLIQHKWSLFLVNVICKESLEVLCLVPQTCTTCILYKYLNTIQHLKGAESVDLCRQQTSDVS